MPLVEINKKDDIVMKIIHYFVTCEDYKPIILKGVDNEIWLENFDKDLQLIRINVNYIHNNEQYSQDLWKANMIKKNISKRTFAFNTHMLNILVDTGDYVVINDSAKNISSLKVNKISDLKKNKKLQDFFPSLKEKISTKKSDLVEFMKLSDEMNTKTIKEEKKLDRVFRPKKPHATEVLMGINLGIFLLMFISSLFKFDLYYLFTYYGSNNYELIQSEGALGLYRLITSLFIHADIFHIGFNMYALYIIGSQIERYYGRTKFLIIYFISGIVGSLFSNVFMGTSTISFGASGAIFGLFGALGYFAYNYRATLGGFLRSSIIPVIIINLCLGIFISGIDVSAHIGGLIGGILCSVSLGVAEKKRKSANINSALVLIMLVVFMIYMLYVK